MSMLDKEYACTRMRAILLPAENLQDPESLLEEDGIPFSLLAHNKSITCVVSFSVASFTNKAC